MNILEMIGKTPIIKLNNVVNEDMAEVYVKLEGFNPGGSVKDRAALGMIEAAQKEGLLKSGDVIVEPTSGNTGIALAMIGGLKGHKVILVMPDTMSKERRAIMKAYGAELVLTEGAKGMKGAIEKAYEMAEGKDGYFIPQQFNNEANSLKHYETTAEEIYSEISDVDYFVAGVGTGGTITGVGRRLKELNQNITNVAVEPTNSAVLSGEGPGSHKIQGIGAGFEPKIYDGSVVDRIITIKDEEAVEAARKIAQSEGLLLGISSGASIAAAIKLAKEVGKGKKIVVVSPDDGVKYLSTGLY
ncbi:cysteine synthase A [Oceanirhabdus seepicola]|uniref:Cysteine synthase n=2 Tax=Oceanirhabdus seepicola TaxID=2828781 RepID=A0A9J6P119_9CLOT|nr:cysteine synthase A [Oceanirhabdus seepicola]